MIKNVTTPLVALEPSVSFKQVFENNHSKLIIENYDENWNVLTFKSVQGE